MVVGLVLLSTVAFVLSTEPKFSPAFHRGLGRLETLIGLVFAVEYALRLWSVKEQPRYASPWGRLKYALRPIAIIDLFAFFPSIVTLAVAGSIPLRFFRFVVLFRVMRLGRYGRSLKFILGVLQDTGRELAVSLGISVFLLLLGAILLWGAEGDAQPEAFGSVPRAMWWAVATLTTVGYGDVYPITPLGRVLASVVALVGIGMVALPTGILAGSFMEAFRRRRDHREEQ
jgi:voltage-gated potassium channel